MKITMLWLNSVGKMAKNIKAKGIFTNNFSGLSRREIFPSRLTST